jgi:hypothetical protein
MNGFMQHLGINYFEIFSHVARYDSIDTIFSIAIEHDLDMTQFHAKTTFFHGKFNDLKKNQLAGCENPTYSQDFCLLKKFIYGLK